jgi:hypothetical protein
MSRHIEVILLTGCALILLSTAAIAEKVSREDCEKVTINGQPINCQPVGVPASVVGQAPAPYVPTEMDLLIAKAYRGDNPSQRQLDRDYLEGRGVKQDYVEFCFWAMLSHDTTYEVQPDKTITASAAKLQAIAVGKEPFTTCLASPAAPLTSQQRAAIQQRVKLWHPIVRNDDMVTQPPDYLDEKVRRDILAQAEKGSPSAQRTLAQWYFHGSGVSQDYAEAYFWYSVSYVEPPKGSRSNPNPADDAKSHLNQGQILFVQSKILLWKLSHE